MDCFGVQSVDTVRRCTTSYVLARPACLRCLVSTLERKRENENVLRIPKVGTDCFGVQSVDTVHRCTTSYLLARPACL